MATHFSLPGAWRSASLVHWSGRLPLMNWTMVSQLLRPLMGPSSSPNCRSASARAGTPFPFPRPAALPGRSGLLEFVLQHGQHGTVKFFRLRDAHAQHAETDDRQPGAGKQVDHAAGTGVGETEIVGLDEHERLLDLGVRRERDHLVEHAAVLVGVGRPEFQAACHRLRARGGQDGGLEIGTVAGRIDDVVAVGVADRLGAGAFVDDVAHDVHDARDGILAAEHEQQATRALALGVGREIVEDVLADQLLRGAVTRVRIVRDVRWPRRLRRVRGWGRTSARPRDRGRCARSAAKGSGRCGICGSNGG